MTKVNQSGMMYSRRPSFFSIFTSNLTAESLKLPLKFIKHMEGRTSGTVSLIGPSRNMWHVDLTQGNDDLFFDKGWPAFVRDHCIESGDLLVFRYDGELHFIVQAFDKSACEKEAAFNSQSSQDSSKFDNSTGQRREGEEVAAPAEKGFQGVLEKIRELSSEFQSECVDENQEEGSREEKKWCVSLSKNFALPSQSKACNVKPEDEEKKVAQSFMSSFPYFMRIMKRFNISGSYTLNIPYQFSMTHLPNCKTVVILHNLKGASWTVNSVPTTKVHTSHTFCGGWLAFVRSNEIKLGDIYVFELLRECELRVHILRVGKEDPHSQIGKIALTGLNIGSTAMSCKKFDCVRKKVKASLKVHSKCMKKVRLCDMKESKMCDIKKRVGARISASGAPCCQSKIDKEKSEPAIQSGNNVETEISSQARSILRMMLALDEEKAAHSFSSCVPHFVRIMRKFNVSGSYTLKIPYKFSMAHLPDCKTEIVLQNLKGEYWAVNSLPDSKGRMVHTFCGGWMAFVRGNDIKMADICIFELINKCEMRVHVSGIGRKELDYQSGKSTSNESSTGDPPHL